MSFKAVIPKVRFNQTKINRELINGMDRYTNLVKQEFSETYQTWNHKPAFVRLVTTQGGKIIGEVSTKDKIYTYVSNGTKRHYIAPRRARRLAFRSSYTAKSNPSRIPSGNGGASGNMVFSNGHWVNGIEARKFDTQIKEDTEERFKNYMLNAFEDAILEV